MENYTGSSTLHNHSSIAKSVVNKLIVAHYKREVSEFVATITSNA